MVRPVLVNFPRDLYRALEDLCNEMGESSTENAIIKMVNGGIIMIRTELDKRKLVVSAPSTILGPDGQYVGRRTGG